MPERVFPDFMHIVHLAVGVDALTAIIMDLVDLGFSLDDLWSNYRAWCEDAGFHA